MTNSTPSVEVQLARLGEQIRALKEAFVDEKTASKDAITKAFDSADKATVAALTAQKESADKSEKNAQAQLEMHNGLIRKMDALVGGFPNKDVLQTELNARDERISRIDRAVAWAYGAAAAGIALAGLAMFMAKG